MNHFHFTTQRRRAKIGTRIISYTAIVKADLPNLDFPDPESAAVYEANKANFLREFSRFPDLAIVTFDGERMAGYEYRNILCDWIFAQALALGATVNGEYPEADETDQAPEIIQEQPQPEQDQAAPGLQAAITQQEAAAKETKELLGG